MVDGLIGKKHVYVTVGTTSFDNLIETVTKKRILNLLCDLGYGKLTLQIGRGKYIPEEAQIKETIALDVFTFKNSISENIQQADLVISHAGAGSILEVLEANKNLIVVINEDLMDNHQIDLATKLAEECFLVYCNCSSLEDCLQNFNPTSLKPFQHGRPENLKELINHMIFL